MDKENLDNKCVIEIKNLKKDYKMYKSKKARLLEAIFPFYQNHSTFSAINNLDLEIHKGEVLGILGKNGAGKSTLLKMITGVVTPTSGVINVNGKISSLLELGAAFNQELTGEENIYQHGQVMGLTKEEIESTKQDIIDFADIGDHLYQPVKTYSSGMFARLAFACAINVNPDILIVDEVLSVGDIAFQLKCFKKFEQFKEKGKTILFVTHNVTDVIRNCNRAVVISNGSKIFDGNVKEGVDKYKKLIVGIEDENKLEKKTAVDNKIEDKSNEIKTNKVEEWKSKVRKNPDMLTYGNGDAEIIDYGIFDKNGNAEQTINNEDEYVVKVKIKFNKDIYEPIFAMSLKDFKGLELCGCNTKAYKTLTGTYKKGDVAIVEYKQSFPLAPERYAFSFGCTSINQDGDLEVFDRKYDAFFIEIVAHRECLGIIDLKTEISVNKE